MRLSDAEPPLGIVTTDEDLVKLALSGDSAAFEALVERYRAATFGAAFAILGDPADAEDVTQEALTQAWRRLNDLREPDRFAGWLYRITQNHSRTYIARYRKQDLPLDLMAAGVEFADSGRESANVVLHALDALGEPHRTTAILYYVRGYRVNEVARLLHIPPGSVKSRLHDARRRLRESLGRLSSMQTERHQIERQKETRMRLFTGRGDGGETDLLGGGRVGKDDSRIAVLGALDEATSAIGLGRALASSAPTKELLVELQRDLYRIMAGVAFVGRDIPTSYLLTPDRASRLETLLGELTKDISIPAAFILPGDSAPGAALDLARAATRRAERKAVALAKAKRLSDLQVVPYLNRLSSLLFVVARVEDERAGASPILART